MTRFNQSFNNRFPSAHDTFDTDSKAFAQACGSGGSSDRPLSAAAEGVGVGVGVGV
jgi:hypothetical protein